jgi:Uncharacterised nucleotidyltransferase
VSRSALLSARGELVARVLAGSWRRPVLPLDVSADALADVTPQLIRLGAGALVWRRLCVSGVSPNRAAFDLRQVYRLQTLEARVHERRLVEAVGLLRGAGVEPVLAKGWAAARLYPEPGLRPYGDIDLWVRPDLHPVAVAALSSPAGQRCRVDLHDRFTQLDCAWSDVLARSRLERLGEAEVRLLGAEDHLRLLCIHMLGHGAWRPVWLCDVAATLESLPDDFDWARCLRGHPRHAQWIACAIGLARQLLGARGKGGPPERRLPRWLLAALLRQWGRDEHYMATPSMAFALRSTAGALTGLRLRWPNPIQATVGVGGPFNGLPRLPFQIAECLVRTLHFARDLPSLIRGTAPF